MLDNQNIESALNGFAALNLLPQVLQAVQDTGYEEPSPIQEKSIPLILEGYDVIGQAQTGTGKTAAFALPILSKIDPYKRQAQALVLAPTRELALQVAEAFGTYAKHIPQIKISAVYGGGGGASIGKQWREIKQGAQIIVATPGRLCDHLNRDSKFLSNVQFLVLDEADEMLKLGFMDDIEKILNAIPEKRQTVLFSATLPRAIRAIAENHLHNPKHVKIETKTQTVERIEQSFLYVRESQKAFTVLRLLEVEEFDAVIAFVRTKQATLDLAAELEKAGYKVAALNGDIAQNQREKVIESIKDGRIDIVVATDVAARGLDVVRITHVFNVDMPYDPESYVHRIGRTGRAGRTGKALLLVNPRENRMLQTIERVTKQKVTEISLPKAEQVLEARINKLSAYLSKNLANVKDSHKELLARLTTELDVDIYTLAALLLAKSTQGQSFDLASIERENPAPIIKTKNSGKRGRELAGGRGISNRPSFNKKTIQKDMTCYRVEVGANDGIAASNLLGAIINESGVKPSTVGRIQIRGDFSLVDLSNSVAERIISKTQKTKVSGKPLKFKIYGK